MKRARTLARLNGRILQAFSGRTILALRASLPLRLALPHLEPVLALNVDKEVEKDRLVILRAGELVTEGPVDWNAVLPQLLQASKEVDRAFLARISSFPVDIVVRYEEIAPIRSRRMRLLFEAALKIQTANDTPRPLRDALQTSYSRDALAQLLYELLRLYAEETRTLSRSVRLPGPLALLRELVAQELLNVMLRVARSLADEVSTAHLRPTESTPQT
ncbi:MAG: hypothetical protein K9K30_00280 [Burkholderiaceae bacterium]|nr:hypothetical protein [Sulfuritalea sp.]MCF8173666.1 hypothetical protein [Burkholderiaceae bacterium]MCF8184429.1 hypothetical protein [Polynucleobacter sp.]